MYRLFLILILFFFQIDVYCQNEYKINYLKKKNAIIDLKGYYEIKYEEDTNNLRILQELVIYEFKNKDFEKSINHINKLMRDKKTITPELFLIYGKSYKAIENYFQAKEQFKNGLKLAIQTKNRYYINQFNREIESTDWAYKNNKMNNEYHTTAISKIKNDFAIHNSNWYGNSIFLNNFIVGTDSLSIELYNPLEDNKKKLKYFFKKKKIGNVTHFKDNKVYFSICDSNNICQIGLGEIENDSIINIKVVKGFDYNERTTYTMPFYFLENEKSYLLYCSNNHKSKGGLDLFFSELIYDDSITTENNILSLNTPTDDVSPFYDLKNQTLYYSNSWFNGFGGLDIFKASFKNLRATNVENIGKPFNSSYNDLNFNIKDSIYTFTSNRQENYHCCNKYYHLSRNYLINGMNKDTISLKVNKDSTIPDKNFYAFNKNIENLFPIKLYFHNDIPNPKSIDTLTKIDYETTYHDYIAMINEYLEQNNKKSQEEIDSFFKVDIPKGYRDLNLLLENIQNELNTGWNFKILIKGFASPLASNSYNLKLSKRRINSIINYINLYENGVFKEKIGKQIMLEFLPYGEEVADKKVNDNPKIKKKSIYSIDAAKERKIELVGIKVSK